MLFWASGSAAARELVVATLQTAPAIDATAAAKREASATAGLNAALAQEICQRIGARCSLQAMPFADIVPGVESGRYQLGVGNVLHTPERARRVLYSSVLWRSSSRLVATAEAIRRQSPRADETLRLESLQNASVAVVRGTQQASYAQRIAGNGAVGLVEVDTLAECLAALRDGRAGFALLPVRGAYFHLAAAAGDEIRFVGPALTADGLGGSVHVVAPKSEGELLAKVDAALAEMRADGTFLRIVRRFMPFLAD